MALGESNGKLTYWIMGVLIGLVMLLAVAGWRALVKEIDQVRHRQIVVEERVIHRLQFLERAIERLRRSPQEPPPFQDN